MNEVGQAIRDEHDKIGVSREIPILLFMDNAGIMEKRGHQGIRFSLEGETQCCLYVPVSRLPETNMYA